MSNKIAHEDCYHYNQVALLGDKLCIDRRDLTLGPDLVVYAHSLNHSGNQS